METAISIHQVSKHFQKVKALDNVSLEVNRGELFGLIGPDGAGKTTLFRLLTTLLLPDSGSLQVDGFDTVKQYEAIRNRIGYMPGKFSLYQDMTVEENLNFFASVFGTTLKENYALIEDIYCQIEPFKHRRAGKLSGGMKQKLALCCALIHKPSVLFLDEPTTGVDPVSRYEFWQMLHKLRKEGITMVVSTPYMDEALMCDRIALISAGSMLQVATPQQIIDSFGTRLWSVTDCNLYSLLLEIRADESVASCNTFGESLHVTFCNDSEQTGQALQQRLQARGFSNVIIRPIAPGIEDCYIKLTTK